ncbi:MAG: phytanoyl-CoA dioxygenase family protein [Planctomycetota bacterium]
MAIPPRDYFRSLPHLVKCAAGYVNYRRTGSTPDFAYQSLRRLTCLTDGRFNRIASRLGRPLGPPELQLPESGILGPTAGAWLRRVIDDLDRDGYHVFDQRLPEETCDALERFALETPGYPLRRLGDTTAAGADDRPESSLYDRERPLGVRHQFVKQALFECPAIQALAIDPSFYAVARGYLRLNPILDLAVMWWSAAGFEEDRAQAAQMYHIDMDWVRFLNFNIYLTDVTPESGPHVVVRGSHRTKPRALRRDGRLSDEQILAHYPEEDVRELTGPRGTISVVDTSSLHKGKALTEGDRLFCQIRFSSSGFGQNYETVTVDERFSEDFRDAVARYPGAFPDFVAEPAAGAR